MEPVQRSIKIRNRTGYSGQSEEGKRRIIGMNTHHDIQLLCDWYHPLYEPGEVLTKTLLTDQVITL